MNTTLESTSVAVHSDLELVAFYVDHLLVGVDILQVEEINRQIDVTPVPHAPKCVRGVINLRGDVVTVVDLRQILGLDGVHVFEEGRTVVARSKDERIGLLVDRIADVVLASSDDIDPPPANVGGVEGRFFKGILKLDTELLVILDVDTVLTTEVAS